MRKGPKRKKMTLNRRETKRTRKMTGTKIISRSNGKAKANGKSECLIIL